MLDDENKDMDAFDRDEEEYNKQLLKQTAITFSRDGLSNDLKYFIQKKVNHNKTNLCYLTQLFDMAVSSESTKVQEMVFLKNSSLKRLLEHVCDEIIKTDVLLNKAVDLVLNKDASFNDCKDNS